MRSVQTDQNISLAAVKPLDGLNRYREHCLAVTAQALRQRTRRRTACPADGAVLEPAGDIGGLPYAACPKGGGFFLAQLPEPAVWAGVLREVSRYRHSPQAFHTGLAQSRAENVYAPKLEWIQETLRLQEVRHPAILEAMTAPSDFTELLERSGSFSRVVSVDETAYASEAAPPAAERFQAAVLLESLDRVHHPAALLANIRRALSGGGLLFATALVASGFDIAVLGLRSRYLYPPDRTNCFSLEELVALVAGAGFALVEVSTPGVLDVEIVRAHVAQEPSLPLSAFERRLLASDQEAQAAFQAFLQQGRLSSFTRIAARAI